MKVYNKEGFVELHSILLKNLFIEHEYNEVQNKLNLGVNHFWASDPNMELELDEIIKEDAEAIKRVGEKDKANDSRLVGDFDNLVIYRIHIYEDRNPYVQIEYGFHQFDDDGVRLVMGFPHSLRQNRYNSELWKVEKSCGEDDDIRIFW